MCLRETRHPKGIPHIIPITQSNVNLKGFITKDSTDMLLMDKFPSFEYVMANIILFIRINIPRGTERNVLQFRVSCPSCKDKKGLPFEYKAEMPDAEEIRKSIDTNLFMGVYFCPNCNNKNLVDFRTFLLTK